MSLMKLAVTLSIALGAVLLLRQAQAQTIYTTTSQTSGNTTTSVTTTPLGSTITRTTTVNPSNNTRTTITTFEPAAKKGYDTSGGNRSGR